MCGRQCLSRGRESSSITVLRPSRRLPGRGARRGAADNGAGRGDHATPGCTAKISRHANLAAPMGSPGPRTTKSRRSTTPPLGNMLRSQRNSSTKFAPTTASRTLLLARKWPQIQSLLASPAGLQTEWIAPLRCTVEPTNGSYLGHADRKARTPSLTNDPSSRTHDYSRSTTPPSVFLSSPGDVASEREIARQIVEELIRNPLLRGRVTLEPVYWDDPASAVPMIATISPQVQ